VFERFTERARRIIILAREDAGRFRQDFVGAEHVLSGLIRDGEGVATAVLQRLGLPLETIRSEVERTLTGFPKSRTLGEVPFTPQAKRVLELSIEEARQLRHKYVGTEHLLLGLMKEGQSLAAKILESLGARLDDVRRETLALLADQSRTPATASAKTAARAYFEEVFNQGNMGVADAICIPQVVYHARPSDVQGLDAVKSHIAAAREAIPDIAFTVEDLFGEDDRVAVRWSLTGTRTGAFRGTPRTIERLVLAGNTLFRLENGKSLRSGGPSS
jgi:predicted ester cyclase